MNPRILFVPALALLLIACKDAAVYSRESFAADSPFKLKVKSKVDTACESARRALLGQGYLIEDAGAEKVKARKAYKSGNDLNNLIEMNVVCVGERRGSTLYATGVLSTYDLKKSGSSASVGVSAVGSISLPFGQSADSLVKVGEETIDDAEFYRRFFAAVEHTLDEIESGEEPSETPPPAPLPEPALPQGIPAEAGPGLPLPVPAQPAPGVAPVPMGVPSTSEATPAATTPSGPAVVLPAPAPEAIPGPQQAPVAAPAPTQAPVSIPPAAGAAAPLPTPAPGLADPSRPATPTLEVTTPTPTAPQPQTPSVEGAPTPEPSPATPEDPASIFE
jgi:hypothetical protein